MPQGELDFLQRTYGWMSLGLALTGAIAWLVANTPSLQQAVFGNPVLLYGAFIAEFVLVVAFATRAERMSLAAAAATFTAYAALNGVTMATIFVLYTATSISRVFFVCAGAFAALALYGATTKRDLTSAGRFMFIGLVGILLASVANLFLKSAGVYWISTYAGVLVFAGLTAYDNQKLRELYARQGETGNLALQGALILYLDFINLFLMLLRIFGRRRDS
ncbi:MAG: Bax inhibitor-1/YccA family protein [Pseudomonadota bacterium]